MIFNKIAIFSLTHVILTNLVNIKILIILFIQIIVNIISFISDTIIKLLS